MRIDIKGSIDVNKLIANVVQYVNSQNYRKDFYLIMSLDTRHALMDECNDGYVSKEIKNKNTFDRFCGVPIAICNKLDFGEVDII